MLRRMRKKKLRMRLMRRMQSRSCHGVIIEGTSMSNVRMDCVIGIHVKKPGGV
jgi:hypothetical protein